MMKRWVIGVVVFGMLPCAMSELADDNLMLSGPSIEITSLSFDDLFGYSFTSAAGKVHRLQFSFDAINYENTGAELLGDGSNKVLIDPADDTSGRTYRVTSEPGLVSSIPMLVENVVLIDASAVGVDKASVLQSRTNLNAGTWNDVEGVVASNGQLQVRFLDLSGTAPSAYYRVATLEIFSDDFEGSDTWTTTVSAPATFWERGTPNLINPFVFITNAASGATCWGTDLDSDYKEDADIKLRSPVITLPSDGPFSLEWMEWVDNGDGDLGQVYLIDLDAGTTNLIHTSSDSTPSWNPVSAPLPASATGHSVQLEFHFLEQGSYGPDWGGWYIDDVAITD